MTINVSNITPSRSGIVNSYSIFNGATEITKGSTLTTGWYVVTNQTQQLVLVLANQEIVYLADIDRGHWDLYSKVIKNQFINHVTDVGSGDPVSVSVTISSTPFVGTPKNYEAFVASGILYLNVYGAAYKVVDGTLDNTVNPLNPAGWDLAFSVDLTV